MRLHSRTAIIVITEFILFNLVTGEASFFKKLINGLAWSLKHDTVFFIGMLTAYFLLIMSIIGLSVWRHNLKVAKREERKLRKQTDGRDLDSTVLTQTNEDGEKTDYTPKKLVYDEETGTVVVEEPKLHRPPNAAPSDQSLQGMPISQSISFPSLEFGGVADLVIRKKDAQAPFQKSTEAQRTIKPVKNGKQSIKPAKGKTVKSKEISKQIPKKLTAKEKKTAKGKTKKTKDSPKKNKKAKVGKRKANS